MSAQCRQKPLCGRPPSYTSHCATRTLTLTVIQTPILWIKIRTPISPSLTAVHIEFGFMFFVFEFRACTRQTDGLMRRNINQRHIRLRLHEQLSRAVRLCCCLKFCPVLLRITVRFLCANKWWWWKYWRWRTYEQTDRQGQFISKI